MLAIPGVFLVTLLHNAYAAQTLLESLHSHPYSPARGLEKVERATARNSGAVVCQSTKNGGRL